MQIKCIPMLYNLLLRIFYDKKKKCNHISLLRKKITIMNRDKVELQEFNSFSKKWCTERTKELLASPYSYFFREHPKSSVPNYDEYLLVIKNPMWFKEVLDRLNHGVYTYVHDWVFDMECIWENAFSYNAKNTPGYDSALILQKIFRKECVPVPSSQKNLVSIRKYKILKKLAKTLLNPPSLISRLQWDIPRITNEKLPVGEDLIFEIRQALFKIEPETKLKLFANPIINEIINTPEKVLAEISVVDETKQEQNDAADKSTELNQAQPADEK